MSRRKIVKLKKIGIKRYFSLFISLMLILNSVGYQFIDNKVFAGKEGLSGTDENLSEVQKVQEVENEIVDNFEGLKFSFDEQNKIASVIGFEEGTETDKLSIPQYVNTANLGDFRVYKICSKAFEDCNDLQKVTLPETLKIIEKNAFEECYNLNEIIFSENSIIKVISERAFCNCSSLKEIKLPDSIEKIEKGSFAHCTNLEYIELPKNLSVIESQAFSGCLNLTSITIPSNVTEIKNWAFRDCEKLEYVYLFNFLNINENAFLNCYNLREIKSSKIYVYNRKDLKFSFNTNDMTADVVGFAVGKEDCNQLNIPDYIEIGSDKFKVYKICSKAFEDCNDLQKVTLPETLKIIEKNAFEECYNLNEIIFSENSIIKVISERAFCNCSSLKEIELPDSIEKIEKGSFAHCTNLEYIELPKNLSVIESQAFSGCLNLTSITIPGSVTEIKNWAFRDCEKLEYVYLFNFLNINENAFLNCYNLREIKSPKICVYNRKDLKFSFNTNDMTADVVSFAEGKEDDCNQLNIPDCVKTSLGNFKVCKICSKAFEGRLDLQEITFPKTLKIIEENAFYGCENLKKVTFQENSNLESICKNAFAYCLSLENVNFPNSLKSIGSQSFECCKNLKNVILPESIDLIEERTFYNCSNLTRIDIPKNITCIKKEAFKRCFNLETINFSESLETIEEEAFLDCGSLKEIVFKDSVKTIGCGIFECCTNLTNVILPKNTNFKSIKERTFYKCAKLEKISLPEQINTIESYAFYQCDNLKTVDFSKTLTSVFLKGLSFYECKNLKIDKKDFCKFSSYEGAFFGCNLAYNPTLLGIEFNTDYYEKQIAYVDKYKGISQQYVDGVFYIPENLEINGCCFKVCGIKNEAFKEASNLKVVYIPKTIEFIGNKVFLNCKNLTKVVCDDCETLFIAKDAFKNCESLESVVFLNKGFCFNNKTKEVFKFSELLKEKKAEEEKQYDRDCNTEFNYPYGNLKLSPTDTIEILDNPKNVYIKEEKCNGFKIINRPYSEHSPLFKHSPSVFDVQQSYFGNCYFLASFAAFLSIPGNDEKILENIKDNNDGTVTIALFNKCGNKVFVKVSRKIPEAITKYGNLAIFNEREFTDWISLWFKAYIAASNCENFKEFKEDVYAVRPVKNVTYEIFDSGNPIYVFEYVFGFFNNKTTITEDKNFSLEEKKEIIEKIKYNIKERLPIVCGTKEKVNKKILVKNHCYALVGISERNKKFYLQLIDPHGRDLFKRLPFNKKSLIGASGLFSIKFEEFLENSAVFTFIEM